MQGIETTIAIICVIGLLVAVMKIALVVVRPKSRIETSGAASTLAGVVILGIAVVGVVLSLRTQMYAQSLGEQPLIMLPWLIGFMGCLLVTEGIMTSLTNMLDDRNERRQALLAAAKKQPTIARPLH